MRLRAHALEGGTVSWPIKQKLSKREWSADALHYLLLRHAAQLTLELFVLAQMGAHQTFP